MYKKRFFLYYSKIKNLNASKKVYIIEDNVSVYYKARRLLVPLISYLNIQFLNYLVNSLDFYSIKYLYKN